MVDAWGRRRGQELNTEPVVTALGLEDHAIADFFSAAFDPEPRLTLACADSRRREFVAALLETPDYRALHADILLDDTASEIAAAAFAKQFADTRNHKPEGSAESGDAKDGSLPDAVDGGLAAEIASLRAAAKAVAEARAGVEELRDTVEAFGMGSGSTGSNDPARIATLFKQVRSDPALKRICDLAGRFRRVAQSKQRRKSIHGLDEVVWIEPGGDIARVLPSELVKLTCSDWNLTLCAAWPSVNSSAARSDRSNRWAKVRFSSVATRVGRWKERRPTVPRPLHWLWRGWPAGRDDGRD